MLASGLSLIISFIFVTYIYILLLRVLLQKCRASWANPISQFTYKLTEPLARPLRKIIPSFWGFDFCLLVIAVVLQFITIILTLLLRTQVFPAMSGVILLVIASLGMNLINIYFYSTIIVAIMSWFPALQQGPVAEVVYLITHAPLAWIRRYMPMLGGMDFSPVVFILLLLLINVVIFGQIFAIGMKMAYLKA